MKNLTTLPSNKKKEDVITGSITDSSKETQYQELDLETFQQSQ